MNKSDPGSRDFYASALPDEPIFVLMARDPEAPDLIEAWAERRARRLSGADMTSLVWDDLHKARGIAIRMRRWRAANLGRWHDEAGTTPAPGTLANFAAAAATTAIYPDAGARTKNAMSYAVLGLAGEAGEIANTWKKVLRGDKRPDPDVQARIKSELGDVLWYVAAIAREAGVTLDAVAAGVLDKLGARQDAGTLRGDGEGARTDVPTPGQIATSYYDADGVQHHSVTLPAHARPAITAANLLAPLSQPDLPPYQAPLDKTKAGQTKTKVK